MPSRNLSRSPVGFVALVAVLICSGCAGPQLAPTPNLYWAGTEHPFDEVPEEYRTPNVELLYATDREYKDNKDGTREYNYGRSQSVAVGVATVSIGDDDMTWDDLVEASTSRKRQHQIPIALESIDELVRLPSSTTPMQIVDGEFVERPEYLAALADAEARIHALLRERLAHTSRKEVFIFVHGYNNTIEDAAIRMATLWHYLGRQGVPFVYSWPAGHPGMLRGYTYDRESSEFTVFHLKQVLGMIHNCPEVERISIVAHSRGTDVTLNALREFWIEYRREWIRAHEAGEAGDLKLKTVIIAAADIDFDVFRQRVAAERLVRMLDTIVFYLSDEDRALGISRWLFGGLARLGRVRMQDLPKGSQEMLASQTDLQVVDADVNSGFVGHAYFITNPAVLSDLILVLRDGKKPGAENGRPLERREDGGFWTITDDYLVPKP